MKTTKTIEIPAKPASTKEISVYSCDCCGKESKSGLDFRTCVLCRRMVCRGSNGCRRFDPYDHSDYPDDYCPICYDLKFEKYAADFVDIEENYEEDLERLNEQIKEESLAHES